MPTPRLTPMCSWRWVVSTAVLSLVGSVPSSLAAGNYVKREGQKLSVELRNAPLDQTIGMLEKDAGIVVRAPAAFQSRTVNVTFQDAPLERGMKQLLRSASINDHAVLYEPGPKGRIVFVVFDKTASPAGAMPPVTVASAPAPDGAGSPVDTDGAAAAMASASAAAEANRTAEAAAIQAADAAAAAARPQVVSPWGRHPTSP